MQVPPRDEAFVYDSNDPQNIEDRMSDPDDGIDYEAIVMATEADFRARRGILFTKQADIRQWINGIYSHVQCRRATESTTRVSG